MLIYNHKKEFLGISAEDLSIFGFSDLSQLVTEASDFADLFVKTPGFVHNFKHVHWIDFVLCAESSDDSKAIIRVNGRNFKCILDVQVSYLAQEPTQKAYLISLSNLMGLSGNEDSKVTIESQKSTPKLPTDDEFDIPASNFEVEIEKQATVAEVAPIIEEPIFKSEPEPKPKPAPIPEVKFEDNISDDAPLDLLDLDDFDADFSELNDVDFDTIEEESAPVIKTKPVSAPEPKPKPTPQAASASKPAKLYVEFLNAGNDYIYDPQVASDELGLPVDLIEEFIEDFIAQAYEFKDELFKSLDDNDMDNVKVLSHKLKGVAANLRIEDAFEVLATVNTSDDLDVVMRNMNTLYLIVDKLDGKEPEVEEEELPIIDDILELGEVAPIADDVFEIEEAPLAEEINNVDDDLIIDFKTSDEELDMSQLIEVSDDLTPEVGLADIDDEIALDLSDFEDMAEESVELEEVHVITYTKMAAATDIGINQESFNELFRDYLQECESISIKLNNAIAKSDVKSWKQEALVFKGMSDNMRIEEFKTELESIITTSDANVAQNAIDTIDTKVKQLSQLEG